MYNSVQSVIIRNLIRKETFFAGNYDFALIFVSYSCIIRTDSI